MEFQDLLEDLAHQDVCGVPYPLDQAPYNALAVQLQAKHANPSLFGAVMMQEALTGRVQIGDDELCDILADTHMMGGHGCVILYWPDEKFVYAR